MRLTRILPSRHHTNSSWHTSFCAGIKHSFKVQIYYKTLVDAFLDDVDAGNSTSHTANSNPSIVSKSLVWHRIRFLAHKDSLHPEVSTTAKLNMTSPQKTDLASSCQLKSIAEIVVATWELIQNDMQWIIRRCAQNWVHRTIDVLIIYLIIWSAKQLSYYSANRCRASKLVCNDAHVQESRWYRVDCNRNCTHLNVSHRHVTDWLVLSSEEWIFKET